jgi:hypothetical protein
VELVKRWWTDHGTKIAGFGTAILGTLTTIDHETVNLIGQFFGPTWGPRVSHGIFVAAGLVIAHRGFVNTNTAKTNGTN